MNKRFLKLAIHAMKVFQFLFSGHCTVIIGLSVHPKTIHRKLYTWQEMLDLKVKEMKESWAQDGSIIYQLIGDNWDKNILPSYRTSDKGTLSLHLFNVIAVQDRVPFLDKHIRETKDLSKACSFLPSIPEQEQLMKELTFLFATSIVVIIPT